MVTTLQPTSRVSSTVNNYRRQFSPLIDAIIFISTRIHRTNPEVFLSLRLVIQGPLLVAEHFRVEFLPAARRCYTVPFWRLVCIRGLHLGSFTGAAQGYAAIYSQGTPQCHRVHLLISPLHKTDFYGGTHQECEA